MRYYQQWKPLHPAGTSRLYSNPSIMLLGVIAAARMDANFTTLMQRDLFAPLGLHHTFLDVPARLQSHYAQGYTDDDTPHRMSPGPLAPEAYGIRTTASDLLRFLDANMNELPLREPLRRSIIDTHTGYFRIGAMTQDLIWEQYRYPVAWSALLQGNSDQLIFEENPAAKIDPFAPPTNNAMLDKTGSTSGFSAYVAFIPSEKIGIVLLANKAYPIDARIAAAYHILTRLDARTPKPRRTNSTARV
jgi:CubicO group peptidase (beta-lactamase class C family)